MTTRRPAVAGQFYPANRKTLHNTVLEFMDNSGIAPASDYVAAIIAPHAGYVYSGPTAGYAYGRIRGKKPRRVILVGCSHRYPIDTASVYDKGSFETPLGTFPVDEDFAAEVARETDSGGTDPHMVEHALEVQLPFLHVALGETPIVPVLFGGPAGPWHARIGARLAQMVDETDLVIASTDLSHYENEERANQIDACTLDTVLGKDTAALATGLHDGTCSMCGGAAVVMAMAFASARAATQWSVLDYRTSGPVSGDYDRVVGYGAVSMERAS